MSTTTPRLSLVKPANLDTYDVGVFNGNADILDAEVGVTFCTSTTRPATPKVGREIFETNTGFHLAWDGDSWERLNPDPVIPPATITNLRKGRRYTTNATLATTSGTTETLAGMETGSFAYVSGRVYVIHVHVVWDSNTINDQPVFRVREDNLAGAQILQAAPQAGVKTANVKVTYDFHGLYTPTSSASKTFVLTVARLAGSGVIRTYGESVQRGAMWAEEIGAGSDITTV